ncbi:MAG: CHAD domain-containing protein [Sulfuricurvum sp.]|nr:CHAD domain-containing protein [Sulfuricurvum sp.]
MHLNTLTKYLTYQLYHAIQIVGTMGEATTPENVHDFRVALRRVRSLVKLYLKKTLPFPDKLKKMLRQSNSLRELDVLIESISVSKAPLTHRYVSTLRDELMETLITPGLKTKSLTLMHRYYDALCDADPNISKKEMVRTVMELYTHSMALYHGLNEFSTQNERHSLRIQFKNIRYGLEFLHASGLLDHHELLTQCKMIQTDLGDIQDLYNQISWLEKLETELPASECAPLLSKRREKLALRVATGSA